MVNGSWRTKQPSTVSQLSKFKLRPKVSCSNSAQTDKNDSFLHDLIIRYKYNIFYINLDWIYIVSNYKWVNLLNINNK